MKKIQMIVRCPKCNKQYDLIEETRKSQGKPVLCPHCKSVVAK